MKYILLFLLLFIMGGTIIVKAPERRQFSHIKLDIGHSLVCRYSGMVVPLNDTSISNWDPDQIRGKALFISLASVISMNSTVESVLFTLQQYSAKGLLLAVPILSDRELQSIHITVNDTVVANKITIWCVLVNSECGDYIQSKDNVNIVLSNTGELHTKPFIVIRISVFICFGFILVAYFYIRYHYSNNRIRKRALEKVNKRIALIPSTVYKESMNLPPCSICLEQYVKGEKISILPCQHAFHYDCIVPWLGERNSCCPVCKNCPYHGKDVVRSVEI